MNKRSPLIIIAVILMVLVLGGCDALNIQLVDDKAKNRSESKDSEKSKDKSKDSDSGDDQSKDSGKSESGSKNSTKSGENDKHTQGTIDWSYGISGSYTGQLLDGKPDGEGTWTAAPGTIESHTDRVFEYVGQWISGNPDGQGKGTWPDGSYYDGDWSNGARAGEGTYYSNEETTRGNTYKGTWENNEFVNGRITMLAGTYYEGEIWQMKAEGNGETHFSNGTVEKGEYRYGKLRNGTVTKPDGQTYQVVDGQAQR